MTAAQVLAAEDARGYDSTDSEPDAPHIRAVPRPAPAAVMRYMCLDLSLLETHVLPTCADVCTRRRGP